VRLLAGDILHILAFVLSGGDKNGNVATPLDPPINPLSKKTTTRGFRHAQMGALLVPVDGLADFMKDPKG
jgi:hypothetical protein